MRAIRVLLFAVATGGCNAFVAAMDVDTLRARIAAGTAGSIIDVRSGREYASSRIPGAINVPAVVVADRRMPPLGEVVVYGDASRPEEADAARAALDAKPGIRARLLEGGYQAWLESGAVRGESGGMAPSRPTHLNYRQLARLAERPGAVVLLDVRAADERVAELGALTDLSVEFPGVPIIVPAKRPERDGGSRQADDRPARGRSREGRNGGTSESWRGRRPAANRLRAASRRAAREYPDALMVLIDSGGQRAEALALALRGTGLARVAVLEGGEFAVRARGESKTEEVVQ